MSKKIAALLSAIFFFSATPALGQSTTYTYDNNGRVKTVEDTNIGVISYVYDDAGNLLDRVVTPGVTQVPPTCGELIETSTFPFKFVYPLDVCSDTNGDTLTIAGVTITSNNGASYRIWTDPDRISIAQMPCGQETTADVSISDGNGGTGIALVRISRTC